MYKLWFCKVEIKYVFKMLNFLNKNVFLYIVFLFIIIFYDRMDEND